MALDTKPYLQQVTHWPKVGRHILAQYDTESIIVYQAYRPAIGNFAAEHGYFGGPFKLSRMSWIKPNFLWMMYRCGWGTKEGQEVVLAVRIKRSAFDYILSLAVHSIFNSDIYETQEEWEKAVSESDVRLQWDPDHDPKGEKVERRAIQLGLRGKVIAKYAREWILDIQDISDFVAEQHEHAMAGNYDQLQTPTENVYSLKNEDTSTRLGLSNPAQTNAT